MGVKGPCLPPFLGHSQQAAPTSRSALAALVPAIAITSVVHSVGVGGPHLPITGHPQLEDAQSPYANTLLVRMWSRGHIFHKGNWEM